ncbi:MAG TPA: S-layer homology domain-containing protein [Chloroflexia bacterium]|nr:S-layer homology domain-containing protein [Chloroflexia bacterium]
MRRLFFFSLLLAGTLLALLIAANAQAAPGSPPPPAEPAAKPGAPASSSTLALNEGFERETSGPLSVSELVSVVATCTPGGCGWVSDSSLVHSGTRAAHAPDVADVADQALTLYHPVAIPADATAAALTFWHRYTFEAPNFDGGVLELSANGTTWTDAGALITSGGYNGTIDTGSNNPLASRAGWVGATTTYSQVTVNLTTRAGQAVYLRWRLGTDGSGAATGWYVDDVQVSYTAPLPCGPATWSAPAVYPTPIRQPAVATQGSFLYSFGGFADLVAQAGSYRYDTALNTWTAIAPLPAPRAFAAAASDGFYIYIVGGRDLSGTAMNTLYRYNPTTNTYAILTPFPTGAEQHAVVYLAGKLYRIAGQNNNGTEITTVDIYTIGTNTWAAAAAYPRALTYVAAVALNGYVYAGGGGANLVYTPKTYRYDPAANTWNDAAVADLPLARGVAATGVLNGRWLLAGGVAGTTDRYTAGGFAWNPAGNAWASLAQAPVPAGFMGSAVVGQSLYTVGGLTPSGATGAVQQYSEPVCAGTATPTRTVPASATRTRTALASATRTRTPGSSPTATPGGPTPCPAQYTDVDASSPFYAYVRCLACRGIVSGYTTSPPCTTGTPCFQPAANVTRGQMAKFVSNAAGYGDAIPSTQQTFTDVPYGSPFWIYVERAVAHGVISGYTSTPPCTTGVPCFLPGANVTRGQTAKFVSNAALYSDPIPSTQQTFTDVPISSPFWLYTERAYAHGVISGYTTSPPCTTGVPCFGPGNNVTRGQTSKFISNGFFPGCVTP